MATVAFNSPLRAMTRLLAYLGLTLAMLPVQAFALRFSPRLSLTLPLWYHHRCCRLLGIHVVRRGRMSRQRPTLFVSNHVSYLDILVLGSLIPGSFIAKSDIRSWPLFGWLARLQRSVFVERRASRTATHRDQIRARLGQGDRLVLFPEGTSGDGNRVLPYKSALLSVAEGHTRDKPLAVQPMTIAYTKLDGIPLGRHLRPFYAWYGDMELLPHVWQLAGMGRITVEVQFHRPVSSTDFASRKELCDHCYEQSAQGMSSALAGRAQGKVEEAVPG
jgi:1-acyl-sn-glycerol-3-phosphate acyltransferase